MGIELADLRADKRESRKTSNRLRGNLEDKGCGGNLHCQMPTHVVCATHCHSGARPISRQHKGVEEPHTNAVPLSSIQKGSTAGVPDPTYAPPPLALPRPTSSRRPCSRMTKENKMASSIGTTVGSMFKPINCPIPEYALCDLAMGFCVRELMSYVAHT